ncbi:B12-binding domain-containing protein [Streptomyces sp. NPDC020965]|uniref:B12-binding domain-containing protein n=1 Tax=Streptomyces sp. NPDC020965 TaxID=3365105 RepID=UPI0037A0BF16
MTAASAPTGLPPGSSPTGSSQSDSSPPGSFLAGSFLAGARDRLWDAMSHHDQDASTAVVLAALDAGLSVESALLDLIAPVQTRVGAEWAANRVSVAQEHVATAISERIITVLADLPGARPPARLGRITVACVDHEWHALPARLLSQVLTLRGWQVDFLGARVPTPHLIAQLHRTGPDAVALSSSLPTHLPTAHATITACQATGMPVLVGGAAFGPDGRYARLLGANAWAPDARTAAETLRKGIPRPDPLTPHLVSDDLPHLADQEYTLVARSGTGLVAGTLAGLERRYPPLRDYTDRQRHRTAEDIARIVDFLAAALYVDDDELFAGFLTWTAEILTARDVPAPSLLPALAALRDELRDFPRCARVLDHARTVLDRRIGAAPTGPE